MIGCGVYQLYYGNTQYLARGFEGSSYSIDDSFYCVLWWIVVL